jgi:formylglycine-generating enzyme required for sulfatase activity
VARWAALPAARDTAAAAPPTRPSPAPRAAPVGSFANGATPEGVFDLAGNIWEWTAEGHLRGGPWCLGENVMASAVIAREDPERADDKSGFRVVVEP